MYNLPTINMEQTGKNIRMLRKQNNMTVSDIQDIFEFNTPNAIYKWEHGKNLPTIDNLVVLATLFGTKIDDIIVVEGEIIDNN